MSDTLALPAAALDSVPSNGRRDAWSHSGGDRDVPGTPDHCAVRYRLSNPLIISPVKKIGHSDRDKLTKYVYLSLGTVPTDVNNYLIEIAHSKTTVSFSINP